MNMHIRILLILIDFFACTDSCKRVLCSHFWYFHSQFWIETLHFQGTSTLTKAKLNLTKEDWRFDDTGIARHRDFLWYLSFLFMNTAPRDWACEIPGILQPFLFLFWNFICARTLYRTGQWAPTRNEWRQGDEFYFPLARIWIKFLWYHKVNSFNFLVLHACIQGLKMN